VLLFRVVASIIGYGRNCNAAPRTVVAATLGVAFTLSLFVFPNQRAGDCALLASRRAGAPPTWCSPRYRPRPRCPSRIADLSLRELVTVFPVALDRVDYVLVDLDRYPWHELPDVTLEHAGYTVTITLAGRPALPAVATQAGPHPPLRRFNLNQYFGNIYPDPRFRWWVRFAKITWRRRRPLLLRRGCPPGAGAATESAAREPAAAVYRSSPGGAPDDVRELSCN
jgi:hypothetical protein